jgi:Fe2+ or Zn2+ uptake regulation protein
MLLDYAENLHSELTMLKEKYHSYIKGRNYRKSYERDTLIDLIVLKNITTPLDLAIEAKKLNISKATCYNVFAFLKSTGIANFTNTLK